ncbi:MAG: ABC transporter ATP-binding protein [Gemmatimonadetes bacterium]|nr:ABC transporter ATP-binding protein [Gemmatimonadota bacterium]MYI62468.1 ABC transporter ATP-binding protein [Gemmatimonadota bacterium]
MSRSDPEFWNRRTSATAIWTNLRWTFVHIWAHGRAPALGIVAVQILLGIQPALLIYITQHLIDTVVASAGAGGVGFEQTLPWLLAFGLVLLLTSDVLWQIRDALHLRLEQNLEHALGRRFLAKASRLPLVFFEVSASYDRLERAKNPGLKLDRFFFAAMHLFQAGIRVLSITAMFVPVSLWISLALLVVLLPQIRLAIEQSRRFMSFTYGQTEEMRRAGYVDRVLTGRGEQKEMRLFALRHTLSQRWRAMRQALRKQLWRQQQQQVRGGLPITCLRFGVSAGVAVALAYFLGDRLLTPGRFVALFRGVDDMLRAGSSLGHSSRELQNQSAEISYVREFLDLPEKDAAWMQRPPTDREPTRLFPKPLREGFAVKDVWFSYPAADAAEGENPRPVLRGVSLHLEPGERVALVGANGAGKSTLAKLLLGLYQPASGEITVDGVHYDAIDRTSLANAVSAAFQDFFNFELTASQSIGIGALGSGDSDQEADLWPAWLPPDPAVVENAARRAGVDAITARLPQGYDTPVGHVLDGGQGLSGGEWQRMAIARAFIRQPELLILDEPTAALDPMAEAEVYRQFGELLAGHTALLISHRLGSARMADRILVLKDGRIVEQGPHDDLVAKGGVYAAMWEEQASWYQ